MNGDSIYNGAHDNAVGVAMMLEIARALHIAGTKPRRSIVFAAVTAEEKGLLGADFFAERAIAQGMKVVANVNMDMPLTLVPLQDFVALGAEHSSLGAVARAAAAAQGYRLSPDSLPEEVRFIRSDQYSFVREGIPSINAGFGYDPNSPEAKIHKDWLTERYHGVSDDVTQPVDKEGAARYNKILFEFTKIVANQDVAPHWKSSSFFKRFAKDGSSKDRESAPRDGRSRR